MSATLLQIQEFIQPYVHAISAILNVGVTVVDRNMVRIGGTEHYSSQLGEKIHHASFYRRIIETGKPGIIKNPRQESLCSQCGSRDDCAELADIAYPIFHKKEVSGIISIVAFSEQAKQNLLDNNSSFKDFLKYMSMLLESKLISLEHNQALEKQLDEAVNSTKKELREIGFIGENQQILEILDLVHKISHSDSTVLITGESGTGKDVLAKVIHDLSARSNKLMISINCGAIPENLIESELFGYEAGAFTGAGKQGQPGKFELANGSTLFLDEIGEMSVSAQTKLLRVLQEKEIYRVGGKKGIPIDVRVICATNQDPLRLIEERRFRMDLYYRINVIPVSLPPLRQRRDDIPLFVDTFVKLYNKQLKKNIAISSQEVMDNLVAYDWPGNVRELKNIMEYLVNIKEAGQIKLSDLPSHILLPVGRQNTKSFHLKTLLAEQEKYILGNMLMGAKTAEDKKLVAHKLGISLATLYRKAAEYSLT